MYACEFVHPKQDKRTGKVRISVIARPTSEEKKYYRNKLRVEVTDFKNPKENHIYIELNADDGIFLAQKLFDIVSDNKSGEHNLLKVTGKNITINLGVVLEAENKGIKMTMSSTDDSKKTQKSIFVPLTKTRMGIMAKMIEAWCLTIVPQIAKSKVEAQDIAEEVKEEKEEEVAKTTAEDEEGEEE